MANQTQEYIKLEEPINDYLLQSEQSMSAFYKCWQLAFRAMEDLGIDFFYQTRTVKLPVAASKVVYLPSDYLNWAKVGVFDSVGQIVPLAYNDKLTTYAPFSTKRLTKVQDATVGADCPIWFNYWDGSSFSNLYGSAKCFSVGTFKVDGPEGVIILDPNFPYDYVALEYMASPAQDQDYFVPRVFREAIAAFVGWQDIAMLPTTRRGALGDKEGRKHNYYNERRKAIGKYRPLHLEQAYQDVHTMPRIVSTL